MGGAGVGEVLGVVFGIFDRINRIGRILGSLDRMTG
jgi:hypothetical protein